MPMIVTPRALPPASGGPAGPSAEAAPRAVGPSLLRGARGLCPACGEGRLFARYLKVAPFCATCGEELHHHRADDAPPYVVILAVGHIVVPLLVIVEELYQPPVWGHLALWLPLTLALSLVLLPIAKGALVSLQWALRMHGFDPSSAEREPPPAGALHPSIPPAMTPAAS